MKRLAIVVLILLLTAASASCIAASAPASPSPTRTYTLTPTPTPSPTPLPGGFVAPFTDVHYEVIPQVNPGRAKETKIDIPEDMEMPQVVAYPDGSVLVLGEKLTYDDSNAVVSSKIMAAQYDATGKTEWSKTYSELADGTVQDVEKLPDAGFVFTYGALVKYINGQNTPYTQYLVFCDLSGKVLEKYSNNQAGVYQFLCPTQRDMPGCTLYVLGEAAYRNGELLQDSDQAGENPIVSVMAFDIATDIHFYGNTGLTGYAGLSCAAWSPNAGLVFSANRLDTGGKVVAAIDGNGKIKWEFAHDAQSNLFINQLLPAGGGILAQGFNGGKEFILKLDSNGKKLWEIAPDGDGKAAVLAMAALPGGGFAEALNRYDGADPERLYDKDGKQTKKIKLPNEMLREIQPTDDGGLLTVGMQNVKALPQPAYVNSIWFDTETIATKYDKDMNIRWRKVYDKYKGTTQQDIVVPTPDGSVIVEK